MKESEKGQISIMIGLMITTFVLLFAFAVNTGMLVSARINIQNAADLAAYAGAAVQARQLNTISYLNYEMRKQWKKLLFRLYVIGNVALPNMPPSGSGPISFKRTSDNFDFQAPVTCIIFGAGDNFCQTSSLQAIKIPLDNNPLAALDQITSTLVTQLQQIESTREANCTAIGITNKLLNYYWLFNTDPLLQSLLSPGPLGNDQLRALQMVASLTTGIGIVPREFILSFRIKTLQKYVNAPRQSAVTLDSVSQLATQPDPAGAERTLQAFYSAYYTLGKNIFYDMQMDELIPSSLLELVPITQAFDTYAMDLQVDKAGNCNSVIMPISVPAPIPVGFYKKPTSLTYYTVRVKAKAHVLFSPFGDVELKAYAAAQPFGSRIGPELGENSFAHAGRANGVLSTGLVGFIPNLPVLKNDPPQPGSGQGWSTKEVIAAAYGFMGLSGTPVLTKDSTNQGIAGAMQPNPFEPDKYNIMSDTNTDYFVRNFDASKDGGKAVFWAPVFPPGASKDDVQSQIAASVQGTTGQANQQGSLGGGSSTSGASKVEAALVASIGTYLTTLQSGNGEYGEGVNTAVIQNPFQSAGLNGSALASNANLFLGPDSKAIKTSWNAVNDPTFRSSGRVGYSVKMVSFKNLTSDKTNSTASESWSNDLIGATNDSEADLDIPKIQH